MSRRGYDLKIARARWRAAVLWLAALFFCDGVAAITSGLCFGVGDMWRGFLVLLVGAVCVASTIPWLGVVSRRDRDVRDLEAGP